MGLRDEITRIGAEVRNAAGAAEDRIAQSTRIAEATVRTRAETATAEALRDLTFRAADLSRRVERQSSSLDARERLEEALARLHAAEDRLRDSDERTRRALRHLRAVPEGSGSAD
jgi:hypothetical protein